MREESVDKFQVSEGLGFLSQVPEIVHSCQLSNKFILFSIIPNFNLVV